MKEKRVAGLRRRNDSGPAIAAGPQARKEARRLMRDNDQRPVPVPVVVPVEPVVPVVPVVPAAPAVPLPQAPEVPAGAPVVPVVGVLPVVPVVGLPRSVMAPPLPVVPVALVPDEPIESVDLQPARARPIDAARMTLKVVRFIFFSLHIGLRPSSCERTFRTTIGRKRQYV
jgi:hypothetical protein